MPYFHSGHENYGIGEDSTNTGAQADVIAIINSGKAIKDLAATETGKRLEESQKQADVRNKTATKILNQMY